MAKVQPSIGRIVIYKLSHDDARQVRLRRAAEHSQDSAGNPVAEADDVPMVVVRVWANELGAGVHLVNGRASATYQARFPRARMPPKASRCQAS